MTMKVTGIEPQTRSKDRVNIYIDGRFIFGLLSKLAEKLFIGQILSEEEIEVLLLLDETSRAKSAALNLLKARPRSVFEIRSYLLKKNYSEKAIIQAIAEMQQNDFLNDHEFAKFWVEQREAFNPRGRFALRSELAQKGIQRDLIDEVLVDLDEYEAAVRAGTKKALQLSDVDELEFKTRLSQYLRRRGFEYEVIADVVRELRESAVANHR